LTKKFTDGDSDGMLGEFFSNEDGVLPLFIHTIDNFPHVRIVHLKGSLDSSVIPAMTRFFEKARHSQGRLNKNVILDLKKVTQVDTAALAQLLKIFATLKQKRYRLALMNMPETIRGMIEILRLDHVFLLLESDKKAYEEILAWSSEWED